MAELADRVFCFYDMQGAGLRQRRSISEELASQITWEAFQEMALVEQSEAQRTKAYRKPQAFRAGDGQGRSWPRSSAPGPPMWMR